MHRHGPISLILALAAGGVLAMARPAAASGSGIPVYTWTDANGVPHFSDTPRPGGAARKLVLPVPPPPDQTAIAAERAWVRQLNRDTQADLARQAANRAERQRQQAEIAAYRQRDRQETQVNYYPVFYPARYYRRHYHHVGYNANLPSARFPSNALPSSFPPGLPSSFPEEPSFWPPHH